MAAAGFEDRSQLVRALAAVDSTTTVEGGQGIMLSRDAKSREILQTLRQLPNADPATQQNKQPVTLRVYRIEDATIVCLINESPWNATAKLELQAAQASEWSKLGNGLSGDAAELSGNLTTSSPPELDHDGYYCIKSC